MATAPTSPEELVNLALDAIGYEDAVGSLFEGTRAARVGLRLYSQTRDEVLRESDWPFARQDAILNLLKTAPAGGYGITSWTNAYPPLPWIYEYAYPANCLEMRSVRPTPIIIPELDPQPYIFRVLNDTATGQKVVVTNLARAIGIFTAQIVDMTQWEPLFVASVVDRLAKKLAPALASLSAEKIEALEEAQDTAVAEVHAG